MWQDTSLAVKEPESKDEAHKYLVTNLASLLFLNSNFHFSIFYSAFLAYVQNLGVTQEKEDLLVKCISQNLGYDGGKPVAACIIYKCLFFWGSFELERTCIFDRIVQTIASAIEVSWFFLTKSFIVQKNL